MLLGAQDGGDAAKTRENAGESDAAQLKKRLRNGTFLRARPATERERRHNDYATLTQALYPVQSFIHDTAESSSADIGEFLYLLAV